MREGRKHGEGEGARGLQSRIIPILFVRVRSFIIKSSSRSFIKSVAAFIPTRANTIVVSEGDSRQWSSVPVEKKTRNSQPHPLLPPQPPNRPPHLPLPKLPLLTPPQRSQQIHPSPSFPSLLPCHTIIVAGPVAALFSFAACTPLFPPIAEWLSGGVGGVGGGEGEGA